MTGPITYPFATAEEAWFWTAERLMARREGGRRTEGLPRPCTPDDVVLVLDRLIRSEALTANHAMALRAWGEEGIPPPRPSSAHAALWQEALTALDAPLRAKGIVGEADHG